jgi:Trk-type K+ transport system membrane component
MKDSKKLLYFAPGRTLFFAAVVLILIGTALLALPISRTESISFLDLFFSATSAVCVTGMFTIPMHSFTFTGQLILLALLQIGGLSLITFTVLIASRFIHFGLSGKLKAQEFAEIEIGKEGKSLLPFVVGCTLVLETIGALVIFSVFRHNFSWPKALLLSFFQAISSFCNIGVSLFGYDIEQHAHSLPVLLATACLMFFGTLGFPALKELLDYIRYRIKGSKGKIFAFSLQTKIILYGSVAITILGMFLLYCAERNNTLATLDPLSKIVTLLFYAISFRSAGFMLVPVSSVTIATILIIIIFGFIGSSPGSTGSGVKITSFALCAAAIRAIMSGNTNVRLAERSIAIDQVIKAFTIIVLSFLWIIIGSFILALTDPWLSPLELILEVSSAFTNLGISAGVTEQLSNLGKLLILLSMVVGRIGSLAFILAWAKRALIKSKKPYSYPEERIMLE